MDGKIYVWLPTQNTYCSVGHHTGTNKDYTEGKTHAYVTVIVHCISDSSIPIWVRSNTDSNKLQVKYSLMCSNFTFLHNDSPSILHKTWILWPISIIVCALRWWCRSIPACHIICSLSIFNISKSTEKYTAHSSITAQHDFNVLLWHHYLLTTISSSSLEDGIKIKTPLSVSPCWHGLTSLPWMY